MASLDTIGPLMTGMKCRPDMAGLVCEALNRMFQKEQTELVAQVKCKLFFQVFVVMDIIFHGYVKLIIVNVLNRL